MERHIRNTITCSADQFCLNVSPLNCERAKWVQQWSEICCAGHGGWIKSACRTLGRPPPPPPQWIRGVSARASRDWLSGWCTWLLRVLAAFLSPSGCSVYILYICAKVHSHIWSRPTSHTLAQHPTRASIRLKCKRVLLGKYSPESTIHRLAQSITCIGGIKMTLFMHQNPRSSGSVTQQGVNLSAYLPVLLLELALLNSILIPVVLHTSLHDLASL